MTVSTNDQAASYSGDKENNTMRISTPCMLSAVLAAISLFCGQVRAATLTVHTQTPKVNVHVPQPKVNVQPSTPKVSSAHVTHQDLHITKTVDKSSPTLYRMVATGKHINSGAMHVRRTGGSNTAYDKKSDDKPAESLSLPFNEIKY